MKTIVIGGAGFIGSHLCDGLLADGHQVIYIDDFSLGTKENIGHLMTDYTDQIRDYRKMEKEALENLSKQNISRVMNVLERARLDGNRIFICGNGGSASTASHYECDFNKGISYSQEIKYDLECLSDNVPMLTAIANDIGYDDIFVVPLRNKLNRGDVVIGISGSGNSENVVRALAYANDIQAETIAICGYGGGKIKEIAKYDIHVKIDNMQIVEEIHLMLDHLMMYILSKGMTQVK